MSDLDLGLFGGAGPKGILWALPSFSFLHPSWSQTYQFPRLYHLPVANNCSTPEITASTASLMSYISSPVLFSHNLGVEKRVKKHAQLISFSYFYFPILKFNLG